MAQYKKNFYSSSLYGRFKALYGEYLTEQFDGQELFTSRINANIEVQLPSSEYLATESDFTSVDQSHWYTRDTDIYTTTANSPIEIELTGDDIQVLVRLQNQGAQTIQATLFKEEFIDDDYTWVQTEELSKSTLSITNPNQIDNISFQSHGFGNYRVSIQALSSSAEAIITGIKVRTAEINLFLRGSSNQTEWSEWEEVSLSKTLVSGQQYTVTGQSENEFSDIQYVQGKLILLSSDNEVSPEVERVELRSDDSELYDYDGTYEVTIDMEQVATSAGKTFDRASKIKWTQQQPDGTTLDIRSSSSLDNIFWGPVSAPYRQDTNRLRLKRGVTSHSVVLGPIDEASKFEFTTVTDMISWDTQAYPPLDSSNTMTSFIFSKTKEDQKDPRNLLQQVDNPHNAANHSIQFSPQSYFLTVEMTRSSLRGTPVVDFIDIDQTLLYQETVNVVDQEVSAVDSLGTGLRTLQRIDAYPFSYPSETGHISFNQNNIASAEQEYYIEDKTRRPSDILIYLKSEESKGVRTNRTIQASDEIIARAIQRNVEMGETSGVLMHYQYGAGSVQYLRPHERELDSVFTPFLDEDTRYRYCLVNGWPSENHTVLNGQTLQDIADMFDISLTELQDSNPDVFVNEDGSLISGQVLTIPNYTVNDKVLLLFENGTVYTEKSSHNALYDKANGESVTDFSSENIEISVPDEPEATYVDWVSEEKIYYGIINANDIRQEFVRTQYNRSTNADFNRQYTVVSGDTWESIASNYDIDVLDLQFANTEIEDLQEGDVLVIPPNIILPELAPEVEFEGDNPYEISIIDDSVRKTTGEYVDKSFIPIDWEGKHQPLTVTYRDSEILTAEMTRGTDANGMDPLPLSHVTSIVSVTGKSDSKTYREWNDFLETGDFKLTNNYIDWSPSGSGILEPEPGEEYVVTYIRQEVDMVQVHLDTTYFEQIGTDLVWRSPEIKVFEGICSPSEDFKVELPTPSEFEGFSNEYKNVGYIIEDNDLWVDTSLMEEEGTSYLVGSLKGKDPSKNWHPTINTGYYYLKEQEFYLYSQPMKTVLEAEELPTVENIYYVNGATGIGALLQPSGENLIRDSIFATTQWKVSKVLNANTIPLVGTVLGLWRLGVNPFTESGQPMLGLWRIGSSQFYDN